MCPTDGQTVDASEGFFRRDGSAFIPSPQAVGPWSRDMLHGRLLGGLAALVVEAEHRDPDFHPARLTVDLFRSPPMAPVVAESRVVRDGNRVRVAEVTVVIDGLEVARASVVMLRTADQPQGTVWSPPGWDAPLPDAIAPPPPRPGRPAGWTPPWETRPAGAPGFGAVAQKRTWLRENRDLVDGVPLTPFVRAAVAADYANPLANSGDQGLQFINADITLYLHRLPRGDWIGFEVSSHGSAEGVAVGACTMYDTAGSIGHSLVCSVANVRRRPG